MCACNMPGTNVLVTALVITSKSPRTMPRATSDHTSSVLHMEDDKRYSASEYPKAELFVV